MCTGSEAYLVDPDEVRGAVTNHSYLIKKDENVVHVRAARSQECSSANFTHFYNTIGNKTG